MSAGTPDAVAVTLRAAAGPGALQRAFAEWRAVCPAAPHESAVLVEGLFAALDTGGIELRHLGAGCPCCTASAPLRVALTRLLRERRPRAVLLLVAADSHPDRIGRMLGDGRWGVPIGVDQGVESLG